jgi:hypothetical protein
MEPKDAATVEARLQDSIERTQRVQKSARKTSEMLGDTEPSPVPVAARIVVPGAVPGTPPKR